MNKILFFLAFFTFSMNAQLPSYLPTNGLVAYYPFNGNANDVSSNSNNGTNNGATLTTDRFGNANSAFSFNGINNYISTNTSSIPFPNGITFCAWIKPTTYKNASIVDKMLNIGNGFRINTRENSISPGINPKKIWSQSSYYGYTGANNNSVSTTDQQLNNWQFVVGTFGNDGVLRLYYNGILENQITTSYSQLNNSPILIGRGSTSSTYENFQGLIDDIGVWNRALTSQEVQNLFVGEQTLSPFCSNDEFLQVPSMNINSNDAVVFNNEIYTLDLWITPKKLSKYNPVTGIVSVVSSPTLPTLGETSLVALNNKFYSFGGWTGSAASNKAYEYNTITDTWTILPNLPSNITQASAVALNGFIYITGATLGTTRQYVYKFNPIDNTYVELALPSVQRLNSKLLVHNNNIYCLGGHIGSPSPRAVNNFDVYNSMSNTWSPMPNLPVGLTKIAATIKNNYLYSFGGSTFNGAFSLQYGYMAFDFVNNNWIISSESLPFNNDQIAAVPINDEIYIVSAVNSYKYFCNNSLNLNIFNNSVSFEVYPNPASEFITIDCGNTINFRNSYFQLINTLGQVVISQNINSQLHNLKLTHLMSKGLYFIKLFNSENELLGTKKIIIK